MSTPNRSPWFILSARLGERDRVYYAGPGWDLHLVGHDDWLLIATTPDDPRPWVMSTELWAEHYGTAHNWPAIYRAIAGLSAEAWAGSDGTGTRMPAGLPSRPRCSANWRPAALRLSGTPGSTCLTARHQAHARKDRHLPQIRPRGQTCGR
jgi:hypothetical protein